MGLEVTKNKDLYMAVMWEAQHNVLRSQSPFKISIEEASRLSDFTMVSQPPISFIWYHVQNDLK